jgi:hypothetical protein
VLTDVRRALRDVRRMGHDLAVGPARLVPLDLAVTVCVDPHHSRGAVRAAVLAVLGTGRTSTGALGVFAPDNLTFGTSVRVSRLVAAVRALEGVTDVQVTKLQRLDAGDAGELAAGVLTVHDLEIAQLDADPNQPENGRLTLTMEGGR